jgi:rod shape-determining protein MreC
MKYIAISAAILLIGITGFFSPLRDLVVGIVSPIQFGLTRLATSAKDTVGFFSDSNMVRQSNLDLLAKVNFLESSLAELKTIRNENELLKKQLGIDKDTEQKLLLAQVMGNPADLSESTIIINKGTKDGVRINDQVVIEKHLIGIVRSVDYSRSTVELITSSNISLTAYDIDSTDKAAGLLKGEHGSILSLQRILLSEKVSVDDVIVTSGRDGVFFPNLIVGKVIDVQIDPSQPLKKAAVQTIVDINKLIEVFVIQK